MCVCVCVCVSVGMCTRNSFCVRTSEYTCTVEPLYNERLWEQSFGPYTEVAFVEGLFCTQTVHWELGS